MESITKRDLGHREGEGARIVEKEQKLAMRNVLQDIAPLCYAIILQTAYVPTC